eukprot:TRINITY_DN3760_c0_g2_i2.p1 TRINITY_DN3760_c0_g2~~TRINITY_DN3760_c0_g2_i2.p1  ORF type:complete len:201 (+),score=4.07 TRINITY_DN3760_c0_g2_i2:54-605(+)
MHQRSVSRTSLAACTRTCRATVSGALATDSACAKGRRWVNVFAICSVLSLAAITSLEKDKLVRHDMLRCIAGFLGFCSSLIDYVPPTIFFLHLGSYTGTPSLFLTVVYGLCDPLCTACSFWFGNMRSKSEFDAFDLQLTYVSIFLWLMFVSLSFHTWSTWNTALLCKDKGLKPCRSLKEQTTP